MLPVTKKTAIIRKQYKNFIKQCKVHLKALKYSWFSNAGERFIDFNGLLRVANIIPGRSVLPFHPLSINSGVCSRCLVAFDRAARRLIYFVLALRNPSLLLIISLSLLHLHCR